MNKDKEIKRITKKYKAGELEPREDLAEDLKDFKKKNKKNSYTFDLKDSEKNIKFFAASNKSNSSGLWAKI